MSVIYALGTYSANLLYSAFQEHAYIPLLAILQTLADYIKQNMPELVDTQTKRTRLVWDAIESNGFDKVLFKIHVTAVYEKYIHALEKQFWSKSRLQNIQLEFPCALQKRRTFSPKVIWNGKVQIFETFKSTVESWLIQHDMDYLIKHLFIVEYIWFIHSCKKSSPNPTGNYTKPVLHWLQKVVRGNQVSYPNVNARQQVSQCPHAR